MDKFYLVLSTDNFPVQAFKYLASANAFCEKLNVGRPKYDQYRIIEKTFGDKGIKQWYIQQK